MAHFYTNHVSEFGMLACNTAQCSVHEALNAASGRAKPTKWPIFTRIVAIPQIHAVLHGLLALTLRGRLGERIGDRNPRVAPTMPMHPLPWA